ncbi:MAG: polyprenyl synthetase family protein, partial [Bacteroidales bacterium]|nr:polyprenyl synthetase family protein [Bacteroidales bacterium]
KMLGIAFQIKDDILDFSQKDIGKPMGNDIREKKITLPLIYLLEDLDNNDKQDMLNELAKEDKREEDILRIIDLIRIGGYLDKANSKVEQYSQKAKQALSIFEDSIYKNSLIQLVDYLLKRHV